MSVDMILTVFGTVFLLLLTGAIVLALSAFFLDVATDLFLGLPLKEAIRLIMNKMKGW